MATLPVYHSSTEPFTVTYTISVDGTTYYGTTSDVTAAIYSYGNGLSWGSTDNTVTWRAVTDPTPRGHRQVLWEPLPVPSFPRPEIRQQTSKRRAKRAEVICERALELMRSIVGNEMFEGYQKEGYIEVPSSLHGGRIYRIRPGRRIALVEKGKERKDLSLCIEEEEFGYPAGDQVVARYLLAKFDEKELLKTAVEQPFAA